MATEEVHDRADSWVNDVLAGVIHLFNECFVGKNSDCLHHFYRLSLVVAKARS